MNKIKGLARIFAMNNVDDETRIKTGKGQRYNYFIIGCGESMIVHKPYKVIWEAFSDDKLKLMIPFPTKKQTKKMIKEIAKELKKLNLGIEKL